MTDDNNYLEFEIWLNNYISEPIVVDVREILFTQDFMNKLRDYSYNNDFEIE